ncbi:unnamed protein product [Sphagnum balticum]
MISKPMHTRGITSEEHSREIHLKAQYHLLPRHLKGLDEYGRDWLRQRLRRQVVNYAFRCGRLQAKFVGLRAFDTPTS